ncbi:alpha/beta fold hydrolase [Pararhizobium sp. IMCC21322]|uniref:alpha/beta fold hydrolase n=1 Tax=Pararhizobium sp. IMCC21322 TaxID=3067903 RepID=UPI002741D49F|nr:alpha/beta hydrolase [Pararhizobium sp. IMCC21322]
MSSVAPKFVKIDEKNQIHVIHQAPSQGKQTFVFLNSMGATTRAWEDRIAPALRARGYGTLSFDYRGQGETLYGSDARLEPEEIVSDIVHVLDDQKPQRPIMCCLSIGGLFGVRALEKGANAEAIALINTLRKSNAQVEWINTLEARLIAMGGMPLVYDVLRPVLSSAAELEKMRETHLPEEGYTPWPADHPRRRLADGVNKADWDFPWETLTIPALVFVGLHDRLFRIQKDVDDILERIPNAKVAEYSDGGHSLQAEFPDEFVSDLVKFAEEVDQTEGRK